MNHVVRKWASPVAAVLLLATVAQQSHAAITPGGDASGIYTFDMEEYAQYGGPTGSAFATLHSEEAGITFGEKLVGQVNTPVDGTDVISGTPIAPLTMDTSIDPIFGINIFSIFGSTVIDGIGPIGFPDPEAIGDGSLTVLFNVDQRVIAFDLVGTNYGFLNILFFDRAGGLLADLTISELEHSTYVFSSDTANIAAMTFNNDDWGGIAFDNFRFTPSTSADPAACDAGGPYFVERQDDDTPVALEATVSGDPAGLWDYRWVTDCPGGYFDDPVSLAPTLFVDSTESLVECTVTLFVDDGFETGICSATVTIGDTSGVSLICPGDMTVECDGEGNIEALDIWLNSATSTGGSPANDFAGLTDGCGETGSATVTWWVGSPEGSDDGPANECSATFTIVDTVAPVLDIDAIPIVVVDEDCSGDEPVMLYNGTATDVCDWDVTVTNDAPETFSAGKMTTVTYTATDECGNSASATMDVTVVYGAGVEVHVVERVVGQRQSSGSETEGLAAVVVVAYDVSRGACANEYRRRVRNTFPMDFEAVVANCEPVNRAVTDDDGVALVDLPPGQYIVIALIDSDDDGVPDDFLGHHTGRLRCGKWKTRRLVHLVDADGNPILHRTSGD